MNNLSLNMIRFNQSVVRIALLLTIAFGSLSAIAQNSQRVYQSHSIGEKGLVVKTNQGDYQFQFYNQNIVETAFIPKGEKYNAESHAVVLKPNNQLARLSDKKNQLVYKTKGIVVVVMKSPFDIEYFYKGNELLSEKEGYIKTDSTENIDFQIEPDEVLFGGGARVLGMNRRGNRLQLYNRAHYGYGTRSELMNYTMRLLSLQKNTLYILIMLLLVSLIWIAKRIIHYDTKQSRDVRFIR